MIVYDVAKVSLCETRCTRLADDGSPRGSNVAKRLTVLRSDARQASKPTLMNATLWIGLSKCRRVLLASP